MLITCGILLMVGDIGELITLINELKLHSKHD
jgi:hypothetical protein